MNEIDERQEAAIKATTQAIMKRINHWIPNESHLDSTRHAIADELYLHEAHANRKRPEITQTVLIFAGAVIAGITIGYGIS